MCHHWPCAERYTEKHQQILQKFRNDPNYSNNAGDLSPMWFMILSTFPIALSFARNFTVIVKKNICTSGVPSCAPRIREALFVGREVIRKYNLSY